MDYRMRMLTAHRCQLRDLLSDTSREQACFLMCSVAHGSDETILLVREVVPLDRADLSIHAPDQLSVAPAAMLRVARRAQQLGASACMVHSHPMCDGMVEFSSADDYGNLRTFEFFSRMLPGEAHSCLVWDGALECVAGRVYESPTRWWPLSKVEVVSGERRSVHRERSEEASHVGLAFDRQTRLLGKDGQQCLSTLRVALVGCGGIGSVAATLLVHSGVRKFTLIDFDRIEQANLPRIIGATPDDVRLGMDKVEVTRRYIQAHAPDADVTVLRIPVEDPAALPHLAGMDVIVCGTDDTTSRAYLNQVCHQYYVPILDLGVQFGADPESGRLVKEVGRCNLMLPGTPCLCCSGHVDPHLLAFEGLQATEQVRRRAEGARYVVGSDVPEPSMMVFNMQVAASGILRLTEWVTGLRAYDGAVYDSFRFLGLVGEVGSKPVRKRSDSGCPFCGSDAQLLGVGSMDAMLVAPRKQSAA